MKTFPQLKTQRLLLNRPVQSDTDDLIKLLNADSAFSENTLNIPFPYKIEDAQFFMENLVNKGFEDQTNFTFAIRQKEQPALIGAIGIHIDFKNNKAELGYWLGKDFWNRGFVTEALKEVIRFGFTDLHLNKLYASHFPHNPASGKIMMNCGMNLEAQLKEEYFKNGKHIDVLRYSILKTDFENGI